MYTVEVQTALRDNSSRYFLGEDSGLTRTYMDGHTFDGREGRPFMAGAGFCRDGKAI